MINPVYKPHFKRKVKGIGLEELKHLIEMAEFELPIMKGELENREDS